MERAAGRVYRLPTEAEWEYACRAGTTTEYSFGDYRDFIENSDVGNSWFRETAAGTSHRVGGKPPNAWGLYDMHGNASEWCQDWYAEYPRGAVTDPAGPASGSLRVYRGGCWVQYAQHGRSTTRHFTKPSGANHLHLGQSFRIAGSSDR